MKITKNAIEFHVDTVDDLANLSGEDKQVCIVSDEDRGGVFVYNSSKSSENDGGIVFNGWVRKYEGPVNVKWFATMDHTNSTKQQKRSDVQKAIDAVSSGVIIVPEEWNGPHDPTTYVGGFYDYYDTTDNSADYDDRIELSKLTNTENKIIRLLDRGTSTDIQNGHNGGGVVNEQIFKGSGFHQGLVIDTDNRLPNGILGTEQVQSNESSLVYRNGSISKWQITNDIEGLKHDGLTFYSNNPSHQMIHLHKSGKIRIGRRASVQDFSEPGYNTSINSSLSIDQDDNLDLVLNMRILESGKLEGATPLENGAVDDGSLKANVLYNNYFRLNHTGEFEQNINGSTQLWQVNGFFRYGNRGFNDYSIPKEKHTFNGSISINENVGKNPTITLRTQQAGFSESVGLGTNAKECSIIFVQALGELRYYPTVDGPQKFAIQEDGKVIMYGDAQIEGSTVLMPNLPTSDPSVAGQLWNDNGTVKISAG
jgi:hypothetical protein